MNEDKTPGEKILSEAMKALADARDSMLVIRSALHGLQFLPPDAVILTGMAIYKSADRMAAAVIEHEHELMKAIRGLAEKPAEPVLH